MSARKQTLVLVAALLSLVMAACTNDHLDDGDGPDVILQIGQLDTPPVTASIDATAGGCSFVVEDWSATFRNRPKNSIAAQPYNDIVLDSVQISYQWLNPGLSTPTRVYGLGGVIVETDGEGTGSFPPISLTDLTAAFEAETATVTLLFTTHTIEGTQIRELATAVLSINACVS